MKKPIYNFFTEDHRRLDTLLEKATKDPDNVDKDLYREFRIGLLTHIKMEEKVLFPAAKIANGGEPLPNFERFRLEHGAITTLMAVPPNKELLKVLGHVLEKHDEAEEIKGGMYDICENLTQGQTEEILEQLKKVTPVPVLEPNASPAVLKAAKRILKRAGYDYDGIVARV
ncbi:hemerythrin domain-containing protein [Haloflavibacter putidus]|uniref:Hemerythrin domain-containing protein n=1 Tax=Haloflavibacter putidus TaxID=2576776 RepID=A0A507ZW80_9FLAO|nr:hemerythrin domain-containing protein [Haloflavibacter putidus]TQD39035.1 hemerythrin domain-containing protein [Haloflavibacter putidus]